MDLENAENFVVTNIDENKNTVFDSKHQQKEKVAGAQGIVAPESRTSQVEASRSGNKHEPKDRPRLTCDEGRGLIRI